MSLEDKIDALTTAVTDLTEQVKVQNETVAKALAGKGEAAKPAAKPAAKAADSKPASKPAAKPAGKKKATTSEDVRNVFGPYLTGAKDVPTKKRLIETTKPLLAHFGVERITEVAEEQRDEAIAYGKMLVEAYENGGIDEAETVRFDFMDEDDGDGDEDGDGESVL